MIISINRSVSKDNPRPYECKLLDTGSGRVTLCILSMEEVIARIIQDNIDMKKRVDDLSSALRMLEGRI